MSISFQKNNRLAEEAKHQSTGDNGCNLSGNVRSYRIHQYEVLRIFFRCHLLDNPTGHREGRNTGTTNHRIDFLGAEQVQEFSKQHPADCIHDEGNQTEGDNHQRLQIQEQFSLHLDGNRQTQEDTDDVHQFVLGCLRQTVQDTTFSQQITEHQEPNKHQTWKCNVNAIW